MIFVAGGNGFLGSNVCKKLEEKKIPFCSQSLRDGLDYRSYKNLKQYIDKMGVVYIINCAAYVGGIQFGYEKPGEIFFLCISQNFIRTRIKFEPKSPVM